MLHHTLSCFLGCFCDSHLKIPLRCDPLLPYFAFSLPPAVRWLGAACRCWMFRVHVLWEVCVWYFFKYSRWRHSHGLLTWIGINFRCPAPHGCRCSVSSQTGPCYDWCMEIVFVLLEQSTNLVCVAPEKIESRQAHEEAKQRQLKIWRVERITLSLRALTCHPTHSTHERLFPPWNAFTITPKLEITCTQVRTYYAILENRCKVFVLIHKARNLTAADWYPVLFSPLSTHLSHNLFLFSRQLTWKPSTANP